MTKNKPPSDSDQDRSISHASEQVVDLSVLIDLKEIKSVRQTLDPHRKADRFAVQNFLEIRCALADPNQIESEKKWLPAVLVDVSESGCACMVVAAESARILPYQAEKLQVRLSFRNESKLHFNLAIKRIIASQATAHEVGHLTYGGTIDPKEPAYPPFRDLVRFVDSLLTYQGQMALKNVPVR